MAIAGADEEGAGEGAQPEGGDADGDLAKMLAEARARLNGANTGAEGASGGTGKEWSNTMLRHLF